MKKIFIDLDETLIHSIPINRRMGISSRTIISLGVEKYASHLREDAYRLLESCRRLAPTVLLTSATRDYALLHNEIFKLKFDKKEIIAREDYLYNVPTAYGGIVKTLKKVGISPYSVLIDNLNPNEEDAQLKVSYLGRGTSFLKIREYKGGKDPECFKKELIELETTLTCLFSKEKENITI